MAALDKRIAVTLCLLAALVTIAFLLENPWRFPERRDLPSVRLDVMLHGNKASKSIRAEVTLPANETTQIKIFHDTNLRQLLSVFPLTEAQTFCEVFRTIRLSVVSLAQVFRLLPGS